MKHPSYAVVVTLTRGRQILAIAGFDKPQAEAALELLNLPESVRKPHAQRLLGVLKEVKPTQHVLATPVTPGGLVRKTPVHLPKRAAQLIAKACLEPNGEGLENLRRDLERIVSGVLMPDQVRHPYLESEGFKRKSQ